MPAAVRGHFSVTVNKGVYEALELFVGGGSLESEIKGHVRNYVRWLALQEAGLELPWSAIEVFVEPCRGSRVSLFFAVPVLELLSEAATESAAWRATSCLILLTVRWLRSLHVWTDELWPVIHDLIT